MSQNLNIPFSRNLKTTRRPRWVVWLSIVLVGCVLLIFAHLTGLWFTRNTVFVAAPEDTQIAVHLLINQKTLSVIEKTLGHIPLISNRDLTISDIAKFAQGEVGWFLHNDGSRSIAVRSRRENLPAELLDSKQIVVQELNSRVFLLSEKLQPVGGLNGGRALVALLPKWQRTVGHFIERGSKRTSVISEQKNGLRLRLFSPKTIKKAYKLKNIPQNASIVLATPVFENTLAQSRVAEVFENLVDPLLDEPVGEIAKNLLQNQGFFILTSPPNPKFFLVSENILDETARLQLVKTVFALKHPKKLRFKLADSTIAEEYYADPDLVSVEQRTINGTQYYHATTGSESLFVTKNGEFALSNDEKLIQDRSVDFANRELLTDCDANMAYLSAKDLKELKYGSINYYSEDVFIALAESFESIGVSKHSRFIDFNFCF